MFTHDYVRLTEFQFSEPVSIPVTAPLSLLNATLAQATIKINNIKDRVLISATVGWFNNFYSPGVVGATFTIRRNGIPIASVVQTVSNPCNKANSVYNVARILFVDKPLAEVLSAGSSCSAGIQVTYTLTSDATEHTAFTAGPITLTLAEIE